MKHGLVLSGGGFKGAFQVGAIEVLLEKGIEFSAVAGVSAGALNGALVAQGKTEDLKDLWLEVGETFGNNIAAPYLAELTEVGAVPVESKIYEVAFKGITKWDITQAIISKSKRRSLVGRVLNNLNNVKGVLDNTPLFTKLKEYVQLKDFKIPFLFSLVSLHSGKLYELSEKDFILSTDLAKALLASSNMPIVWEPVLHINTKDQVILNAVDGGLRMINPLDQIFNLAQEDDEPWTIWVISCSTPDLPFKESLNYNMVSVVGHTLNVILNEVMVNDTILAYKMNEWADSIAKKRVDLKVIEPEHSLGSTLQATPSIIETRIQRGRNKALKHFS